jgi:hypothetical protein
MASLNANWYENFFSSVLSRLPLQIEMIPNEPIYYNNKGNTLKQLGRHREAKQAYQQAKKCTK